MNADSIRLDQLVRDQALARPDALAVRDVSQSLTYGELDELAERFARGLRADGVGPGDRVIFCGPKTATAVALLQGVLRIGAAYVPLDPSTPTRRLERIADDAKPRVVVVEARAEPEAISRSEGCKVRSLAELLTSAGVAADTSSLASQHDRTSLAYVLYTSGSTGMPKGVCISHENALAFVDWAVEVLGIEPDDRLANHAPFSFDLSVLDLYGAFAAGGSVHLVPEMMSFAPTALVEFLHRQRITRLYCVPSALILMMDEGGLLERDDLALRTAVFAGEVFPIASLRRLQQRFGDVRLFNFYGPTETNVCAYHEVTAGELESLPSVPIGRAACGDELWAQTDDGRIASVGEEGELLVRGPTVMLGYWGGEPVLDACYRTGDIVRVLDTGKYHFVGRRDHMVKIRGRRIELGEIESVIAARAEVRDAAVVATGHGTAARLKAFVVPCPGGRGPTLLEVKHWCAEQLPPYMIVDDVEIRASLPRNSRGKVDRALLT
jgi:clorobiocin biosynthesis protein CloN4